MAKILVHITHGPDQPTRAALGFLVAKSALEEGHAVSVFLAGDAVLLLDAPALETVSGVGTGRVGEHYQALAAGGARFYVSRQSAQSRGLGEELLAGKPAEFATPRLLVQLALEHDRMFTY